MKSVGEVMAIGRTFKEALQKGIRALDTGKKVGSEKIEPKILTQRLVTPHPERLTYVRYAIRQGHTDQADREDDVDRSLVPLPAQGN